MVAILRKYFCFIVRFVFVALLAFPVMSQALDKKAQSDESENLVAVIAFQPLRPEGSTGNTVLCPICGKASAGGIIPEGAEKIVEEIFFEKLKARDDIVLVPAEKLQKATQKYSTDSMKDFQATGLLKIGRELKADFLAVGYVYRYAERVGYRYSSEHPASVVFEIHLIRTADGKSVWRGYFDKTQRSLMENVLDISSFFKGGAKWMTARELTELGMENVFQTFPDFQP